MIESAVAPTGLARRVLTRPLLWWAIAAVFLVRDVVGNLMTTYRPDAASVILAGQRWLHDPAAVYAETARYLARTGLVPVSGGLIRPPAAAMLGSSFTVLPASWQVGAWTVADALAALAALVLVQRYVARTPLERAVFWAAALYWPPLYAEVNAGQVGGFVLLFACGGLVTYRTRPGWAGALVAAAASLKLYPALMVIGSRIRWRPFLLGAALAGAVITIAACIPLGVAGAWQYVSGVLIPSLRAPNPDCAQTSVSTLFGRSVGGDPYPIVNPDGSISILQSPAHLPTIAAVLTAVTLAAILVAALTAARASGWDPVYGLALGLALGALLPGELNPYQYLPLLPLVLLVLVRAIRSRRAAYVAGLAGGLLLFLRQPCLLPFPNVWTIGALVLFGICVAASRDFRQDGG